MVEKIQPDLMQAFDAHIKRMGIDIESSFDRFGVGVVHPQVVKVQGNVHIPSGRVATRADVERRVRKRF